MIIAINTRVLSGNPAPVKLLEKCFEIIAQRFPEHSFIFINDKKIAGTNTGGKNTSRLVIDQQSALPLLWKLWYNYKLPALLKKRGADVLINADGICSMRTKLPQVLLVNDLISKENGTSYPGKYKKFIKSGGAAFLKKAKHIVAPSNLLKQQIITQHGIDEKNITTCYPGFNEEYTPLLWEEKEKLKEQYSSGKEYFLYTGSLDLHNNIIQLLKAFSFFKRRQKSNMQLLIVAENNTAVDSFTTSLATYKYRNEVMLLKDIPAEELYKITASSYAIINVTPNENNYSKLLNAMRCKVPLIVSNNETNREIFEQAALYADSTSVDDIAEKMMLLFKDENLRNSYIENGLQRSAVFTWQSTADTIWQSTLSAVQQPL